MVVGVTSKELYVALQKSELTPDSYLEGMPVYNLRARPVNPHASYAKGPERALSRYEHRDKLSGPSLGVATNPYSR